MQKTKQTAIICPVRKIVSIGVYWTLTISYMGLIFYLSSIKMPDLHAPHGFDKVLHTGAYAVLAFLSYFSFKKSGIKKYILFLSFIFAFLYGVINEIHQSYVPERNADFGDIIANSLGAFLGGYLAHMITRQKNLKARQA